MRDNNYVAVYGTLREGCGNWRRYLSNSRKLSTERIKNFGMKSFGGFPVVFGKEDSEITIEVFEVDLNTMRSLDMLEGYPSFYNRKEINTSVGKAWIYFIEEEKNSNLLDIESGDWIEFITN